MTVLNRVLLVASPLLVLLCLAVASWIGTSPFGTLTRAVIASVVITYGFGLAAGIWALGSHSAYSLPSDKLNN